MPLKAEAVKSRDNAPAGSGRKPGVSHGKKVSPEEIIVQFGYVGLFVVSMLAASILPFSSEIFVVLMPTFGYNIWMVGIVATVGNYAGALTVYYMGRKGTEYILERYPRIDRTRLEQAEAWFGRWGPSVLLLAGIPIIGDPICLVAGSLHMKLSTFSIWSFVGKGWRYVLILGLWQYGLNLFA